MIGREKAAYSWLCAMPMGKEGPSLSPCREGLLSLARAVLNRVGEVGRVLGWAIGFLEPAFCSVAPWAGLGTELTKKKKKASLQLKTLSSSPHLPKDPREASAS